MAAGPPADRAQDGDVSAPQEHRNEIGGSVFGPALQARTIYGGVHLYQSRLAGPVPSQLPPPVQLSGRAQDLASLDEARPHRVVVISGPPGIGKTALAVHWGHLRRDGFPDGQLFADLRGHAADGPAGPGEILGRFLRALGLPPDGIPADLAELTALYRSVTSDRRVFVMIDDALSAAQASPLLPGSAGSVALVTSRWRLAGLVARGARSVQLGRLDMPSALALLGDALGTRRVSGEPEAARELAQLCAFFPLTLRIAAARLAVRPRWAISEMVSALRQERRRLSLLAVEDDMAIQAALDLSYQSLPASAARLYRLIGLFPGASLGGRLAAAAAALPLDETKDLLGVLADANLLDDTAGGSYTFHDLIKLHAREMAEREDPRQARDHAVRRMLDWYLATVTAAGRVITPYRRDQPHDVTYWPAEPVPFADASQALDWLEGELPNVHAVVSFARDHGFPRLAWQTVDAMWPLFLRRGRYRERLAFDRLGLTAAQAAGDATGQAKMLDRLGLALTSLGELDEATERFLQASAIWRDSGDDFRRAGSLQRLGLVAHAKGHLEEALTMFAQALGIYRRLDERRAAALTLADMGAALTDAHRGAEAMRNLAEAFDLLAEVPDPYNHARTLARLGRAQAVAGERAAAAQTLDQALRAMSQAGSPRGEADVLRLLGDLAEGDGRTADARQRYEAALAILDRVGSPGADMLRERLARLDAAR